MTMTDERWPADPAPVLAREVPAPPAGPGVQPPFAAPPSEGRTARVWLGLGVAGLAVVLCCGGGIAALVGLIVTGTAAINERAHTAVEEYLQAVGAERYDQAYRMLCDELREQESLSEFRSQVVGAPKVREYVLHETRLRNDGDIVVPADVTYTNDVQESVNYRVTQDSGSGEIRFCGTTE
jgi:hypothetical protein